MTSTETKTVAFCIEALTVGGAEQMLVVLANHLIARGWQVHMICLTKEGDLTQKLDSNVKLHVLGKQPGIDVKLPRKIRSLIKSINPTAVNSHLWTGNFWTRTSLLGTSFPIYATEHSRDTWKASHHRMMDRLLAKKTKKLVAVSHDTADFYKTEIGIPEKKVQVINNGVDTKRYASGNGDALRAEWAPDNQLLIGTIGRMVIAKNHIRFLDMAVALKSQLSNFKIVLVGDGVLRPEIEAAIAEKQLEDVVILSGVRTDIPDVLAAFDVFVSSSDREGHPLTALEAQSAGTPVVLTKAGGSSDAIAIDGEQYGGILVEKDFQALADAVVDLTKDPKRLKVIGAFAQQHALANFDMKKMVDQYEALISSPN